MNALWITRMSEYKNSPLCTETAKKLIDFKIKRESILLKRYKKEISPASIKNISLADIFLYEGRMAQKFWREFKNLLPQASGFQTRRPRGIDPVNKLLDIGYHHLGSAIKRILNKYNIPMDLGIMHVARNSDSTPLAYDLVEMFRADIVDAEILRFIRMKKKNLINADEHIAHFLHEINERLARKYHLKDFNMCHTYLYYMEVQILKFIKAVNHRQVFEPIHLPTRHENRCALDKPTQLL